MDLLSPEGCERSSRAWLKHPEVIQVWDLKLECLGNLSNQIWMLVDVSASSCRWWWSLGLPDLFLGFRPSLCPEQHSLNLFLNCFVAECRCLMDTRVTSTPWQQIFILNFWSRPLIWSFFPGTIISITINNANSWTLLYSGQTLTWLTEVGWGLCCVC